MTTFKQSTSWTHQFLMVLSSDHLTGATGKAPVVKLGKNGATAVTASNSPATEVDSTNLPGVYSIIFTITDLNTAGSLAVYATGSACDPTNEFHRVDTQIFPDLLLDGSGRVKILSGVQQNQPLTIMFPMTVNGVPTPGLTVTGNRNFGSGFSLIAGTITDLGNGDYKASLLALDTNTTSAIYRFTANGADDRNIALNFDP